MITESGKLRNYVVAAAARELGSVRLREGNLASLNMARLRDMGPRSLTSKTNLPLQTVSLCSREERESRVV